MHDDHQGRMVGIGDTQLWVVERGDPGGYPLMLLHGGPGDDHHEFADYLDALGDRYRLLLVDQRGNGRSMGSEPSTWTVQQHAADVVLLARALRLERYAVLGHSYGAFVALQNAVDFPAQATQSIVSSGLGSVRWMADLEQKLAAFEPEDLRAQVQESWAREREVGTPEEFAQLMHDQMPWHFADPRDPRIADYEERTSGARYSPEMLRMAAGPVGEAAYGGIELEDRLGEIGHPVLVLAGRHDRTCPPEAAQVMAAGIPGAELEIFEHSGHMTFVEEPERYLEVVRDFLDRHSAEEETGRSASTDTAPA
ncbi:MAG: alpha/beta fold hydrolase [Actinomycetota bacterium]